MRIALASALIHGRFERREPQNQNFNWTRGSYVLAAAGDNDVTAITLRLFDANDRIVAADHSAWRDP